MIWGITGCVGAGKSTVATILAGFGARVLDVDDVAAQALRESSLGLDAAQALRAIVTRGPDRARIEAALVPVVERRVEAWAAEATGLGVLDAAMLFEYDLDRFCDFTVCVCCPIDQRRARVFTTSIVCGWQRLETKKALPSVSLPADCSMCIASAAAVPSSRSEALLTGSPVRSQIIVW